MPSTILITIGPTPCKQPDTVYIGKEERRCAPDSYGSRHTSFHIQDGRIILSGAQAWHPFYPEYTEYFDDISGTDRS